MFKVVDGEQADALRRDAARLAGPKVEKHIRGIIHRLINRWKPPFPFEDRNGQLACVLGLVVIDNCQGDAALEGREGQTCPLVGRIVAPVRDGPPGLAGKGAKHRVHLAQ